MNLLQLCDHFGLNIDEIFLKFTGCACVFCREIMAKEIAMYNRLNSIESLQNLDISTMVIRKIFCFLLKIDYSMFSIDLSRDHNHRYFS